MRAILLVLCFLSTCAGEVYSVYPDERRDVLDGRSFGSAGPYECIRAKAHFRVDPNSPANKLVRDLEFAPRNTDGQVEFSADIYVLKPRDPAKGNGTALFEISNRGGKGMLTMFNRARGSTDPRTAEDFGDGLLMERGFTLVWVGWQFDVPQTPHLLRAYLPAISVSGLVRSQYLPVTRVTRFELSDRLHIPYRVANLQEPSARMTVRDHALDRPRIIPRDQWTFDDATHVAMAAGFEPGKLYEVVYTSNEGVPVGLGMAAVRDFVSFLKNGGPETLLGDQRRFIKRAIGFGTSQSGRFLRNFVYDGFNADEKGRKVFDGLWPHVAGAGRGSFNIRFGQPSRDAQPAQNLFYPTDLFPFTDTEETDPALDLTDGLLARAVNANVVPKIFYTNGSYEYWGRAAALIHTAPDGTKDMAPAKDTRIYFNTGAQHGPGQIPPAKRNTRYTADPLDYRFAMRALLLDMQAWLKDGIEPPGSLYPRIDRGELAPVTGLRHVLKAEFPPHPTTAYRMDFGTDFRTKGIAAFEPPRIGVPYPLLLPEVNEDGNEISGLKLPEIQVPLGTYTGWNFEEQRLEMISFTGSFFPFAKTKLEREQKHDSRRSIEERYRNKQDYLERIGITARKLAGERLILEKDIPALVDRSSALWDWCMR